MPSQAHNKEQIPATTFTNSSNMPAIQTRNQDEAFIVQYIRQNIGRPPARDHLFSTWVCDSNTRKSAHNDSLKSIRTSTSCRRFPTL
mmetsp:Transcript_5613/g.7276  ORF Transcript_5613/g.7276 Transcript_5613/m.7276 type:complete len:87 (+) Transcript_5613:127-387(+)